MYKARQNKVKVSRRIDTDNGRARQQVFFLQKSSRIQRDEDLIQRIRTLRQTITPQHQSYADCPYANGWQRCIHSEIVIPKNVMPNPGTKTSGNPPWDGSLLDAGYETERNATRLHVINKNFGGKGGNNEGNLHPGSQKLNSNHKTEVENKLKNYLENDEYNNTQITYSCDFNWTPTPTNNFIEDPDITCSITSEDGKINKKNLQVTKGDGLKIPAPP